MKYFFYNPYTKNSEGPYTIDMLRELVSKEQIQPDSKLCTPGGKKWIDAAEIGELFSPAPLPLISNEDDDFVHPLSKKGIKQTRRNYLKTTGWFLIIIGTFTLIMEAIYLFVIYAFLSSYLKSFHFLVIIVPAIIFTLLICLGIYLIKRGNKINPNM
jgi:hypothetical protein